MPAIGLGEAAIAFGEVGGDGEGCAAELVGEEAVAAEEALGEGSDCVSEVDGSLMNEELFKGE